MNKILIVVDMQNDFIDGSLGTKEAQNIVSKVKEKVDWYVKNGYMVIFTRDTHNNETYLSSVEGKKLPIKHCIKDTHGWQIGLETVPGTHKVINKETFGYSKWRNVLDDLFYGKNIRQITVDICGLVTDICVVSNAIIIKTLYPEINVEVDASCCAGSTPEKHLAALEVMKSCQIDVVGE